MAESAEYFSVGSIVVCKTCFDETLEGEVMAFDPQSKILILKCPSTSGKSSLNDIRMVNLSFVGQVEVTKEAATSPAIPQALNLNRLTHRAKNQVEEKQKLLAAMAAGVSPEGQRLFFTINRTIDDVSWDGKNILVMKEVLISPPYGPENCKAQSDSQALKHVRKVVEKHIKDQLLLQQTSGIVTSPTGIEPTPVSPHS